MFFYLLFRRCSSTSTHAGPAGQSSTPLLRLQAEKKVFSKQAVSDISAADAAARLVCLSEEGQVGRAVVHMCRGCWCACVHSNVWREAWNASLGGSGSFLGMLYVMSLAISYLCLVPSHQPRTHNVA